MENMFGLGVVIEVEDKATGSLNSVSQALDRTESEARGLSSAFNNVGNIINSTDSIISNSASSFSELANQLTGVKSKFSVINRELNKFSDRLSSSSTRVQSFANEIENVDASTLTQSILSIVQGLRSLKSELNLCINRVTKLGRLFTELGNSVPNITSLGGALDSTSASASELVNSLNSLNLSSLTTSLNNISSSLNNFGIVVRNTNKDVEELVQSLNTLNTRLNTQSLRDVTSAVDDLGNSFNEVNPYGTSQAFRDVSNSADNLRQTMSGVSSAVDETSQSMNNMNTAGANQSIRGVANAFDDLGSEINQCNRQAYEYQRIMRELRRLGIDGDLNSTTQSFSGMIQQMSNVYGGYSEHSRNARRASSLMFRMIQMNTRSANELASSYQGVAQANMNMWKQTAGGKEVAKMFQNLNGDIREARLAVVGFNSEQVAISAEESNATMQRFRSTIDATKASLDRMLQEGTIDTGLYQTALMQLADEQRQIETLHTRGFRTVQQYNQELMRLGITVTSQADLQAIALERNRWAIAGMARSLLQRTNSASKYNQVLQAQQPIYGALSKATLGWVSALQQASKEGDPTVMTARLQALGMSGKEVQDTIMAVSGEVMGFGQVMIGMLPIVAMFYGTLFGTAREMLPWLDEKLQSVGKTWIKVFTPLIKLFGKVVNVFLDIANSIGKWILKFREAHPQIAKVLDVFVLLLPAVLTLVSVFGLMKLSIDMLKNQFMMLAGNVLSFLAKVSPMALAVTAIISILSVGLTHLWKTNKDFRNGVISIWEEIKSKVSDVCKVIGKHWETLKTSLGKVGKAMFDLLKTVVDIGCTVINTILGKGTSDMKKTWEESWKDILKTTDEVLANAVKWITEKLNAMTEVIKGVTAKIKEWWKAHGDEVVKVAVQAYETVKGKIQESLSFIGGIISSVLKVIGDYWNENKDTIIGIVGQLVSSVGSLLGSMQGVVKSILDVIKKFWEEHGDSIMQTVTTAFSIITDIISQVAPVISAVLDGITSFLQKHGDTIGTILSFAWNFISSIIIGTLNNIKGVIEGVLNVIGGVIQFFSSLFKGDFQGMWEGIKQIFTGAIQAIYNGLMLYFNVKFLSSLRGLASGGLNLIRGLWNGIKNFFSTGVTACYVWVDDLVKGIINFFTNLPTSVNGLISSLWNFIKNLFVTGCQWVMSVVQSFVTTITSSFTGFSSAVRGIFTAFWNLVKAIWSAGVNVIKAVITAFVNGVKSIISGMVSAVTGFFRNILTAGRTIFTNLVTAVTTNVRQIPSKIKQFMGEALTYLRNLSLFEIGKNIIQGLINGIKSLAGNVTGAIKGIADSAVKNAKKALGIHSPSRVFKQIGAWTSEGMAIGVEDNAPLVSNSIQDMTDDAKHRVEGVLDVDTKFDPSTIEFPNLNKTKGTTNNNTTNNFTIEVKVDGGDTTDAKDLAEKIMKEIEKKQKLKGIMKYA